MPLVSSRTLLVVGVLLGLVGVLPGAAYVAGLYQMGTNTPVLGMSVSLLSSVVTPLGTALIAAAVVVRHLEEAARAPLRGRGSADEDDAGARMAPRVWNPGP